MVRGDEQRRVVVAELQQIESDRRLRLEIKRASGRLPGGVLDDASELFRGRPPQIRDLDRDVFEDADPDHRCPAVKRHARSQDFLPPDHSPQRLDGAWQIRRRWQAAERGQVVGRYARLQPILHPDLLLQIGQSESRRARNGHQPRAGGTVALLEQYDEFSLARQQLRLELRSQAAFRRTEPQAAVFSADMDLERAEAGEQLLRRHSCNASRSPWPATLAE